MICVSSPRMKSIRPDVLVGGLGRVRVLDAPDEHQREIQREDAGVLRHGETLGELRQTGRRPTDAESPGGQAPR